jgi:RND superfamily putative drug exporter
VSSMLRRLAVFSARHRALVIGVWLVLLVGLGFASHAAGTKYSSTQNVSGSDSMAATDVMTRSFSANLSDSSQIVYHTETGKLTDSERKPMVQESLKALSEDPDVEGVTNPLEKGSAQISSDGKTAYSTMVPSRALGDMTVEEAQEILDTAAKPAEGSGMQVEAGGQLGSKISKPEAHTSELIGIAAAMLILLVVFGTVTAMVIPIAVAIFGLV